jgi:hypothetical protein
MSRPTAFALAGAEGQEGGEQPPPLASTGVVRLPDRDEHLASAGTTPWSPAGTLTRLGCSRRVEGAFQAMVVGSRRQGHSGRWLLSPRVRPRRPSPAANRSRLPVALLPQEPRYVAETLLLELLQYGFEGSRAGNGAARGPLRAPQAIVEQAPRLAECQAAPVRWFEMPPIAEFDETAAMPERMGLEVGEVAES